MNAALPIIVSYFTVATIYAQWADRLRASCDRHGLAHHIVALPSIGSWEVNTHTKATVCQTAWQQLRQPILWVDADALLHARPELLRGATADFGIHRWKGRHFVSSTVFFNQTPMAGRLLDAWVQHCTTDARVSDQVHLEQAWNDVVSVDTLWLPRGYCQVFDRQREAGSPLVIEQFQASRAQKHAQKYGQAQP